jgi:hypothetical protein
MTITQLKYVLAVAEYKKNFTSCSRKCFVTQPTLEYANLKDWGRIEYSNFDRTKTNSTYRYRS